MKRTNKGAQSRQRRDQPPAEYVEKRPPAEGNRVQTTVTGTQGLEAASIGLNRVREATNQGEAEGWYLAYLQDRVLTMSGKSQIYGTQHDIDENGTAYPLPIEEPEMVETLRKEVGLEPLSEATKRIQERHNTIVANRGKNG